MLQILPITQVNKQNARPLFNHVHRAQPFCQARSPSAQQGKASILDGRYSQHYLHTDSAASTSSFLSAHAGPGAACSSAAAPTRRDTLHFVAALGFAGLLPRPAFAAEGAALPTGFLRHDFEAAKARAALPLAFLRTVSKLPRHCYWLQARKPLTCVTAPQTLGPKPKPAAGDARQRLLDAINAKKGDEDVIAALRELAKENSTAGAARSPALAGRWNLLWASSNAEACF